MPNTVVSTFNTTILSCMSCYRHFYLHMRTWGCKSFSNLPKVTATRYSTRIWNQIYLTPTFKPLTATQILYKTKCLCSFILKQTQDYWGDHSLKIWSIWKRYLMPNYFINFLGIKFSHFSENGWTIICRSHSMCIMNTIIHIIVQIL